MKGINENVKKIMINWKKSKMNKNNYSSVYGRQKIS